METLESIDYTMLPKPDDLVEKIGPVWQTDEEGNFILPERTLGWHAIQWILEHLSNGKSGKDKAPFILTPEQGRFILWWYAIDHNGNFTYSEGQFQRLKGHGKDPLVAVMSLFEALGPCRFDGWADSFGYMPAVRNESLPLVQIVATTQSQTDSTMRYFSHYLTKESMAKFKIEINTETVKSNSVVVIQTVTSNPISLEGKSPTFVIINEGHWWYSRMALEMFSVIKRNSAKVQGGHSRMLSITNAYDPSMGSVAQMTRETYQSQLTLFGKSKILYDSIEVVPEAPIFIFKKDAQGNDTTDPDIELTTQHISNLVERVRGDSDWSEMSRIVDEFFDDRNPLDYNRRFWFNSIVSSEDAYIDLQDFDLCVRNTEENTKKLRKGDSVVLFADFSKNDDSTVLMACRINDGYVFKINAWHKPRKGSGPEGTVWLVPRNEQDLLRYDHLGDKFINPYRGIETVDDAVKRAFKDYKVLGFFADPSHARDDVTNQSYWTSAIETWHIRYSKDLKVWAGNKSGTKTDAITFDMIDPNKIEQFAEYCERVSDMIIAGDLKIENDADIRSHFKHAKIYKTKSGRLSIWKGKKNSDKKIDLAVGTIGALMVRSIYLKQFGETKMKYNPGSRFL